VHLDELAANDPAGWEVTGDDGVELLSELAADDLDVVTLEADPCASAGWEVTGHNE